MLRDDVDGKLAVGCAEIKPIGVVMRRFSRTSCCSPACSSRVATAGTVGKFIHRAEMNRANSETILHGVIPTAVFGIAAASHRAVIPNVRKRIAPAGRIVLQHRIGAERTLTTEGQGAEKLGRDSTIDFVIERLTRPRAVDGVRIASPGKAVVDDVSL